MQEYKEHVGACKACGNSPVNHRATYLMATASIWQGNAEIRFNRFPLFSRIERALRRVFLSIDAFNYRLFGKMGVIRFSTEVTKAKSYRSQVIWEEAKRRGIRMEQMLFLGRYTDMYRALIDGRWVFFESLPVPARLHQGAYGWIDDKVLLNTMLRKGGIPMPRAFGVRSEAEALEAFKTCDGFVVTKPQSGSRGRHTTTFIRDEEMLRKGFRSAQMLCRYVCVTEHLRGSVCRGTAIAGRLAGFFQADPPRVVGDGVSTISGLIAKKNATKPDRVEDIILTGEHEAFLGRQGLSGGSVPASGERIDLSHRTGRLFGGETRELLQSVHPKLKTYLEKAATTLGVPVVGFDLIIENPEADPDTQKWGIIEANSLPFIDLHYLPLHGTPSNVAAAVWDLWEKKDPASAGSN